MKDSDNNSEKFKIVGELIKDGDIEDPSHKVKFFEQ